ncbi:DHH family protein [Spiroplasma helicoides]|uniref:DHH family protein n=1 Tax=Spiroplasma helicoides TaxID=216938 RepID=A0A1B3SM94_9MOLU|nr:bifunctional oligoribonuclease/PAP phosphatase NrnA [Spiroplasma helicoides]AOG61051.1 DHH family protein [Spiroplasma helicoides]
MISTEQSNLLIQKINEYENIIIAKHVQPDWDAQGSAIGLKDIIENNFKNKNVYIVGSIINKKNESFEDESKLTDEIIKNSILITVDTGNFARVDFEYKELVKEIFKLDHHPDAEEYSQNKVVDDSAIACTQVITSWAMMNNFKLSLHGATHLYYGLITDSGRFLFEKTNAETFNVAKYLVECGVDIIKVYEDIYIRDFKVAKWLSYAFSKAVLVDNYPIAYILIDEEDYKNFDLLEWQYKLAQSTMANIKEINIWFIAYESKDDNLIKVSIRSRSYSINEVAALHNGGGHRLAAGAKLNNWSEIENIVKDLKKLVDNQL